MVSTRNFRRGLAVSLILLQVVGIIYGRFTKERYFTWAPYEEVSHYEMEVLVDGMALSEEAIRLRYGMAKTGRENRSIHHVISVIRWCENRTPEQTVVRLVFTTNGGKEQQWTWPEDRMRFTD